MRFVKENTSFFVLFVIIGALLCAALGVFLAELFPALSILRKSLVSFGFDLEFLALTVRLNLMSIAGVIIGILVFAKA